MNDTYFCALNMKLKQGDTDSENDHCVYISHLQPVVGCNHWSLIVDRCDVYANCARQAVFPGFRLICHNGEVVSQGVTAVMDIGNILPLHLETDVGWKNVANLESP